LASCGCETPSIPQLGAGDRATKAIAFIDRCGFTAYGVGAGVPGGLARCEPRTALT